MNAYELHASDLGNLELEIGTSRPTLTWNGTDYPCLSGSRFGGKDLTEGGYALQTGIKVVIRASVFGSGARPQEKQTVSFKMSDADAAVECRIDSITNASGGQQIHMDLMHPTKGVK